MKTYKEENLRELYRVTNKYWRTGDTDLLSKKHELCMRIDGVHWAGIADTVSFATLLHKPFETVVDVLALFGYEMERSEE